MILSYMLKGALGASYVTRDSSDKIKIFPASAEELATVVRLANMQGFTLAPEGACRENDKIDVIVSFSRMNHIMHISRENRSAVFGSGVTFGELIQTVEAEGLILNMPLHPAADASVVQSMLRREPVTMPKYHWDSADPLGCLEVVFGNGEIFRTGAAAGPGTLEQQWMTGASQVEPSGPSASSWYRLIQASFGTMGLVTWASTRCEAKPLMEKPYLVQADSLATLVDFIQHMLYLRKGSDCFILNRTQLGALVNIGEQELPSWCALLNITAGDLLTQMRIQADSADVEEEAARVNVCLSDICGGVAAEQLLHISRTACEGEYWKNRPKGTYRELQFCCKCSDVARFSEMVLFKMFENGLDMVGTYIQPQVQGANWSCIFTVYCEDTQEALQKTEKILLRLTEQMISFGAYFMTPDMYNEEVVMKQNPAVLQALRKLKVKVDPKRTLNPGRICL